MLGSLELELFRQLRATNIHAGNQTRVLCKSSLPVTAGPSLWPRLGLYVNSGNPDSGPDACLAPAVALEPSCEAITL